MKSILKVLIAVMFVPTSCQKADEYFRPPETEPLVQTIESAITVGYAATIAMEAANGKSFSFVSDASPCTVFPCGKIITIDVGSDPDAPFPLPVKGQILVAGLWSDTDVAVMTMLLKQYDAGSQTISRLKINTFPVIREAGITGIALGTMDIDLSASSDDLVELDLTEGEIDIEISRLDAEKPADVYVAIDQNAFYIEIDNMGTGTHSDDTYTLTGGGQLIEVSGLSADIIQQAMVDVTLSQACPNNPTSGNALIKNTGVSGEAFPDLGTAIFEFTSRCDGMTRVLLGTGMYVTYNGKKVEIDLFGRDQ